MRSKLSHSFVYVSDVLSTSCAYFCMSVFLTLFSLPAICLYVDLHKSLYIVPVSISYSCWYFDISLVPSSLFLVCMYVCVCAHARVRAIIKPFTSCLNITFLTQIIPVANIMEHIYDEQK